jgi:hypothetical protein
MNTRIDRATDALETSGIVALQLVSNADRVSPMMPAWTSVVIDREGDPDRVYPLYPEAEGLLRSQMFVGAVPPGNYRIRNLHASNADNSAWLNAPVPRLLGRFNVEAGRVTTLGTIVYQPFYAVDANPLRGVPYVVTRVDDALDATRYVLARYPNAGAMTPQVPLGWVEDGGDEMRNGVVERMRDFALGEEAVLLEPGSFAMPARLGQIQWREPSGSWRRIDTGYTQQIAALTRGDDGFIAGGERGLLLHARVLSGPWAEVAGPAVDEAVYWLHALPGGRLLALTRSGSQARFYDIDTANPKWEPVRSFSYEQGFFFTGRGVVHPAVDHDRLTLMFNGEALVYLLAERTWSSSRERTLWRVARQEDGTLLAIPGSLWNGIGEPVFRTREGSWHALRRPTKATNAAWMVSGSLPWLDREGGAHIPGTRMRRVAGGRIERSDEVYLLYSTTPGDSLSWKVRGQMPAGCYHMLPQVSSEQHLFARCLDGRVIRSDDGGHEWVTDRDNGVAEYRPEPSLT